MPNLYLDTAEAGVPAPPLKGYAHVDVAVVGAGFTGLSSALHLAERGLAVKVLDTHFPGFGASGRNGGQVNPGLKADPDSVEQRYGEDLGARMNALAGNAPQFVFDLIARLGIACEARRNGTLRAAISEHGLRQVQATAAQWQKRGAPVEVLARGQIEEASGTARYAGALLDRRGGDLNPLSFARGLARAALKAGAELHGDSQVRGLIRAGNAWQLNTHSGSVIARRVLLATNGYTDALWPALARSIVPVFGAIAATEALPDELARRIMPARSVLYESGAITVYYRIDTHQRLLFGGRGPMREVTGRGEVEHLLSYAKRLWPQLRGVDWNYVWGGRLAMTLDHYPHVHEPAEGLMVCLGYNGRGVALATTLGAQLAGRLADPAQQIDMPLTGIRSIPLHAFWRTGVRAAILRGRLWGALGR